MSQNKSQKPIIISINGNEFEGNVSDTILSVAKKANIEIPVFCYHDKLQVAGNCRMCLVEIANQPKLVASCAMPISEGMTVLTQSKKVKAAREGILEFLLVNHPLDCPICDQGGECDLQDITFAYGSDTSKLKFAKRAVPDKDMGPIISTFMNRCIHCTRCIRFSEQIAGEGELASIKRGENTEIVPYINSTIKSELSGNLVDICPVGALTSRPYAYQNRPWELKRTPSIDILDAVGSNIEIHSHDNIVKRIMPRANENINEIWISDKTRYACDGLLLQRLNKPYLRKNHQIQESSWRETLEKITNQLVKADKNKVAILIGNLIDLETITILKDFANHLKIKHIGYGDGENINYDNQQRFHYLFNTGIANIEQSDFCLIIGSNVRADASMVHTRLRKGVINNNLSIHYLGGKLPKDKNFNFSYNDLGNDLKVIEEILQGTHSICKSIINAKKPMIIIGSDLLARNDWKICFDYVLAIAHKYNFLTKFWNGLNVLHKFASTVGALDMQIPYSHQQIEQQNILQNCDVLYLVGVENINWSNIPKSTFIIYQGHHGNEQIKRADAILPSTTYTEKNGSYINMEGTLQIANKAVEPIAGTLDDWQIIQKISQLCNYDINFSNWLSLHQYTLEQYQKNIQNQQKTKSATDQSTNLSIVKQKLPKLKNTIIQDVQFNFYMSDIISKNSPTMAKCEQQLRQSTVLSK